MEKKSEQPGNVWVHVSWFTHENNIHSVTKRIHALKFMFSRFFHLITSLNIQSYSMWSQHLRPHSSSLLQNTLELLYVNRQLRHIVGAKMQLYGNRDSFALNYVYNNTSRCCCLICWTLCYPQWIEFTCVPRTRRSVVCVRECFMFLFQL